MVLEYLDLFLMNLLRIFYDYFKKINFAKVVQKNQVNVSLKYGLIKTFSASLHPLRLDHFLDLLLITLTSSQIKLLPLCLFFLK